MSSAPATQKRDSAILSRSDLEELIQREAKPGSPVLSVYLNTDQSREVRGPAAERLEDHGSIGAFLRW